MTLVTGGGFPIKYRTDLPAAVPCLICSNSFFGIGLELPADYLCPECVTAIVMTWALRGTAQVDVPPPVYQDDDKASYHPNEASDPEKNPEVAEMWEKRKAVPEEEQDVLVLVPNNSGLSHKVGASKPPEADLAAADQESMFVAAEEAQKETKRKR